MLDNVIFVFLLYTLIVRAIWNTGPKYSLRYQIHGSKIPDLVHHNRSTTLEFYIISIPIGWVLSNVTDLELCFNQIRTTIKEY